MSVWTEPVNPRWLVYFNGGSNIRFLRVHSSLLAAIELVGFILLPHYHSLDGLTSNLYRRVIAFPPLPSGLGISPSVEHPILSVIALDTLSGRTWQKV